MSTYNSPANGILAAIAIRPSVPMTETLSWLTDLQQSFDGTENRFQVRDKPRYSVGHLYEYVAENKNDVFNTVYGAIRSKWAMPLWTDLQYIGTQTGTVITCDTDNYTFVEDEMALIYVSNFVWKFVDVVSVGSGTITVDTSITGYDEAYLIPVKMARPIGDINRVSTGLDGSMAINFRVDDYNDLIPATPAQFLANDIYFDPRLKSSQDTTASSIIARQLFADYELGKVDEFTPWLNSQVSQSLSVYLKTRAEYLAFREWLYRRAGRHQPYWRPSFERDFDIISVGSLTTTIDVRKNSYTILTPDRLHVAFETIGGTWIARTITAVTSLNSTDMRLAFATLGSIPVTSIYRMCYLGLYRLNQDSVDLRWISGTLCQCNFTDIEIAP